MRLKSGKHRVLMPRTAPAFQAMIGPAVGLGLFSQVDPGQGVAPAEPLFSDAGRSSSFAGSIARLRIGSSLIPYGKV